MSPRESAEQKGQRYVVEGRLTVERLDGRGIRARCRGSGTVYALGYDGEGWFCSCPARTRCAHLVALQLVSVEVAAGRREA